MMLVRRASSAAEAALAAAHETRRSAAIAAGRRADESSQLRLLHDTALTTLTLVGTGAITRSDTLARRAGADLALVERLSGAAVDTTSAEGRERLDVQLLAVAREPPAAVTVHPVLDECAAPAFVVAAFVGSVGEALRNVERHAGVRDVDLRLMSDGSRIIVEVADRGRGIDPEAGMAHRHGIRESIVGRMAAVGGSATLAAGASLGTRWTLEWTPPAESATPGEPANVSRSDASAIVRVSASRYARGTALAAITVAGSWHVVNDLTATVLGWSVYEEPAVAAVAWILVAVVTATGALNLLRGIGTDRGFLRLAGVAVLLVCSVGLTVATRSTTDVVDGGIFTSHNWAWAAFGWFVLVLLWRSPLGVMLAVITANWVLVFVAIMLTGPVDRILVSRYVMVVLGSSAIQLAVAVGARALVRAASQAARASAERADVLTARQTADEVHSDRQRRYRELGPAVRQLLGGLAGGELDPSDEQVQRRCSVEASRLRRLIAEHDDAPSPLVHELRACADIAERRDVAVTLETAGSPPVLPVQVRRALTDAPIHLLAAARTQARVTVVTGADDGEVEVSVVADAAPPGGSAEPSREGVEVNFAREGETQWVRARWRDR
jgi:hypothetical protein